MGVARIDSPKNQEDTSGTPGYMAPEVITRDQHSFPVDFFAVGVIAYECMLGRVHFSGYRDHTEATIDRKYDNKCSSMRPLSNCTSCPEAGIRKLLIWSTISLKGNLQLVLASMGYRKWWDIPGLRTSTGTKCWLKNTLHPLCRISLIVTTTLSANQSTVSTLSKSWPTTAYCSATTRFRESSKAMSTKRSN